MRKREGITVSSCLKAEATKVSRKEDSLCLRRVLDRLNRRETGGSDCRKSKVWVQPFRKMGLKITFFEGMVGVQGAKPLQKNYLLYDFLFLSYFLKLWK